MIGQNIVNMIRCRKITHPLFRSFGMGAEIDTTNRLTKGGIQVEVNRWYPATFVESISQNKANNAGEFEYRVRIRGTK